MPQNKIRPTDYVLLLGVDNTPGVKRSDTMMVISIDSARNHVGVLSIPRDTRVEVPGVGMTKINHAYAYGGVTLLRRAVSDYLQLPIHYYVQLDLDGVRQFVDHLGGISVNVPSDMFYTDKEGDLYINLAKGKQTLTGEQSLGYLRYRREAGDIGRIRRQQEFVMDVARTIINRRMFLQAPQLISSISGCVHTNLPMGKMVNLAFEMRRALVLKNVDIKTVPGKIEELGGISYWVADVTGTQHLINSVLRGMDYAINPLPLIETQTTQPLQVSVTNAIISAAAPAKALAKPITPIKAPVAKQPVIIATKPRPSIKAETKQKLLIKPIVQVKAVKTVKPVKTLTKIKPAPILVTAKKPLANLTTTVKPQNKTSVPLTTKVKIPPTIQPIIVIVPTPSTKLATEVKTQFATANIKPTAAPTVSVNMSIATVLPAALQPLSVEILNGNNTNGAAAVLARFLKQNHYKVPWIGMAGHTDYDETMIVNWKGKTAECVALANRLGIKPSNIVSYNKPDKKLDITIVLGKDWKGLP